MNFTRREVTQTLAGLVTAAGTGVPLASVAHPLKPEDLALRLQRELAAHIRPGCPVTRLDVIGLELGQTARDHQEAFRINAVIRLTWPPGVRQRPFWFYGPEPENAYASLRDRIVTDYARVHPNHISLACGQG